MKEDVIKGCMYLIILFAVMAGFPRYFQLYPDFRFFWNICAVLGTGFQMFFLIAGEKGQRMGHLKVILVLLLSVVMANGYYSFEALSSVFPYLGRLSEGGLFVLGVAVIFAFAACGGLCQAYFICKEKQRDGVVGESPQAAAAATAATAAACDSRVRQGQMPEADVREKNGNVSSQPETPLRLRHIFGTAAAVVCVVVPAAAIFYALCKNQGFLQTIANQRLPYLAFNLLTGFVIVLAAIFVVTILIFYFIQMCCSIIREMFRQHKLDLENDALLRCISVFITTFCFFFCRNATMGDLFTLVNGSNEVMSLLIVVMTFTVLAFVTLMVYKILQSFARPDGTLREYTNKIFGLVITTTGDMIINILEIVSKAPNLLNDLLFAAKRGLEALWEILFDMDEDDFEHDYH